MPMRQRVVLLKLRFTTMANAEKPGLAIDVDDVLFPNTDRLLVAYNQQFGTAISESPSVIVGRRIKGTMEILLEQTGLTRDAIIDQVEAVLVSPEFHMVEPLEESVPALRGLAGHYRLFAISARPSVMERQTVGWLTRHYPGLFDSVHILGKRWGAGLTVDKTGLYKSLGASVAIDDLLKNVLSAHELGLTAVLFGDYPWNQADDLPEGIVRCRTWPRVSEYLLYGKTGA